MSHRGFTLLELTVAIILLGIIVVPLAIMGVEFTRSVIFSNQQVQAANLARLEMSKVNNLDYGDSTLADGYDVTTSNYGGYQYDLRRTVDYVAGSGNNLKKVGVEVYPAGESDLLINLVTYVASVSFGPGSGGGTPGAGDQADSFSLSGGSISGKRLHQFTIANSGGSAIAVTGATVTWTGVSGIDFTEVKLDNTTCWSGSGGTSPATVTFDTNFTLAASTSYSTNNLIEFSKNLSTISVTFTFTDGSSSETYSWP